jgi:hypothetical protein
MEKILSGMYKRITRMAISLNLLILPFVNALPFEISIRIWIGKPKNM